MVWLGGGRPCADRLPRRHPAPAPGPRFCRGRFQNTERRHLGSINRGDKTSVDMMARGNGRCPLPRQPHPPSRKADTQTPSGSNHSLRRRTTGLKIPETARSPTPGLRQAHGRCSLFLTVQASTSPCPSQPRTCTPAATLQPSRLVPAEKRASGRCVDRNRHASSVCSRRLKSPNMCQGNLSFHGEGMSRRHPRRIAQPSQQPKTAKSSGN